jgi:hypothetical protein
MGFKPAARSAARCAAAALILGGLGASAGVAGADPTSTPSPTPPLPGPAPSTAVAGSDPSSAPSSTPPPAPKNVIDHDGTFAVGTDIVPGIYSTPGPVGNGTCYWKRMSNPDGALIDNALSKKPQVVQIEPTDKAFKTTGCQPWQQNPDAPPPPPAAPGPLAGAQLQGDLGILNGLLGPNGQQVPHS